MDQSQGQHETDDGVGQEDLRSILKSWGRFPAPAEPDFDCLVHEVLVALHEGFDVDELVEVIQNEFISHFGVPGPQQDVLEVADAISSWWNSQAREAERE
jgi:hypothetical protein